MLCDLLRHNGMHAIKVADIDHACHAGAGLEKGTYQANLVMYSNDPEQPTTRLPLELDVY